MRIEIVGAIGVGKTSLARQLGELLGWPIESEIAETNPFWEIAYAGEGDVQFEKEVSFLLSHGVQIRRAQGRAAGLICDFSFYQDLAYARMGQSKRDLEIYDAVWRRALDLCGPPMLIIDLRATSEIALDRIYRRGRSAEQALPLSFLDELRTRLDEVLADAAIPGVIVEVQTGGRTPAEVLAETLRVAPSLAGAAA